MNKYIIGIDGMGCGMCEIHVQNIIRKNIVVKKVKASHNKNKVVVIAEANLSREDFEIIFDKTGYMITSFERTTARKTIFGWR